MDPSPSLSPDIVFNILRKTSCFPKRDDWLTYIPPEDMITLIGQAAPISEVARKHITGLILNHEDLLGQLFDTGTLSSRNHQSLVHCAERVVTISPLLRTLLSTLSGRYGLCDRLNTLDLDMAAMEPEVVEMASKACKSVRTLGMRHFVGGVVQPMYVIAGRQGLRELFLSECTIDARMSSTIADAHDGSLELLSLTRTRIDVGALAESFWGTIGRGLRELTFISNDVSDGQCRWTIIGKLCPLLQVLRYEPCTTYYDWSTAFTEMCRTEVVFPRENWYRTLKRELIPPTVADPHEAALYLRGESGRSHLAPQSEMHQEMDEEQLPDIPFASTPDGNVYVIAGEIVFYPTTPAEFTVDWPQGVPQGGLIDYFNNLPADSEIPRNLVPYENDSSSSDEDIHDDEHELLDYVVNATEAGDEAADDKTKFRQALQHLGPHLKKLYLYKWTDEPEKLAEIAERCPDTQIHLDLSPAGPVDIERLTVALGTQLTELTLPELPSQQDFDRSRVSWGCTKLTHLCVPKGPAEGEHEHVRGALQHTGHSVTHFEYRASRFQQTCDVKVPLQIMARALSKLRKLVFDCTFIEQNSFKEIAKANPGLREVYLRVYMFDAQQMRSDPSKEERIAGWICTFAANRKMRSIAIEQKCRILDALPCVPLEEIREHCTELSMKKKTELHIQVFGQALYPRA